AADRRGLPRVRAERPPVLGPVVEREARSRRRLERLAPASAERSTTASARRWRSVRRPNLRRTAAVPATAAAISAAAPAVLPAAATAAAHVLPAAPAAATAVLPA